MLEKALDFIGILIYNEDINIMALNNGFYKNNADFLKLISFCPFCETRYNPPKPRVLEERGEFYLLYSKCPNCNGSTIALVFAGVGGVFAVNIITDLSDSEVLAFRKKRVLLEDDVLDFIGLLEDGHFERELINILKTN